MKTLPLALAVVCLTACSSPLAPQRTDQATNQTAQTLAGDHAADVVRETHGAPPAPPAVAPVSTTINASGNAKVENKIEPPPPATQPEFSEKVGVKSHSRDKADYADTQTANASSKLSAAQELVLFAIGGFLIVGLGVLCWSLWKKAAAASPVIAGLQQTGHNLGLALDNSLQGIVGHLQTAANLATTPEAKTQALTSLAAASAIAASAQAAAPSAPAAPVTATVPASK